MKTKPTARKGRIRLPLRSLLREVLTIRMKTDQLRDLREAAKPAKLSLWARKVLFEKAGIEP